MNAWKILKNLGGEKDISGKAAAFHLKAAIAVSQTDLEDAQELLNNACLLAVGWLKIPMRGILLQKRWVCLCMWRYSVRTWKEVKILFMKVWSCYINCMALMQPASTHHAGHTTIAKLLGTKARILFTRGCTQEAIEEMSGCLEMYCRVYKNNKMHKYVIETERLLNIWIGSDGLL